MVKAHLPDEFNSVFVWQTQIHDQKFTVRLENDVPSAACGTDRDNVIPVFGKYPIEKPPNVRFYGKGERRTGIWAALIAPP